MNKLTTTLAGLAIVATASIAPAFAQGAFYATQPFTFSFTPGNASFSILSAPVVYNPFSGGTSTTGFLTLAGGTREGTSVIYDNTDLTFVGGGTTFNDMVTQTTVVPLGNGTYSIASVGATDKGDQFNLVPGAPVPEASTTVSFGLLLALGLGGVVVAARKKKATAA